ncbi:oligosaccharide flippase family protein [Peribacillus simplex]|uniref:lipopolysaccharide biosynthesis protein n=1 Tax=Peribacillus simplex TaxID=1478 RepID=UPI003398279E
MRLENYIKNSQWSGVISLGIGTVVAQLINIIIQPLLTRMITPEELGVYSFIISMANLIIPVASLKLSMLIVVDGEDDNAELLTDVSILTVLLVTFIYTIFLVIMMFVGNNSFYEIGALSFLIPLIILTNGVRFTFVNHNNRYMKYSLISKVDILRESLKGFIQVTSGFLGGGVFGQSFGYAVSPALGLKIQAKDYMIRFKQRDKITLKDVLSIYMKHKKHILYLVPAQFINSFSYALITMSVISLFSAREAGYYSISFMVLGLPLVLISNNVSRVFLQKLGSDYREGKSVWKNYISFIKILGIISILGFSLLAIIAPKVSELIFGVGYEEAGRYITILCFMYALRFIASSLIGGYVVFNKQKMDTVFQTLLVLSGVAIHYLTEIFILNIYEYLGLISITYGIVYLLIIINLGFICKKHSENQKNM